MTPQELATILQEIHRQQAGAMGPPAPLPQIPTQPTEMLQPPPDIAPPQDNVAPSVPPAGPAPPQAPPRVPTGDDARVASLQSILAQQNQRPPQAPHGFMNDFMKPMAAGLAYGNKAPEILRQQQQDKEGMRQSDITNTLAQLNEIQGRQNTQFNQARQTGEDTRLNAENDRAQGDYNTRQAMAPFALGEAQNKKKESDYAVSQLGHQVVTRPADSTTEAVDTTNPAKPVVSELSHATRTVTPPNPSKVEVDFKDGSPHRLVNYEGGKYFDPATNADITANVTGEYHVPPQGPNPIAADTTSYKFHIAELDKRAKPIDDAAARVARLTDNINLGTAQADAIIAPELISVIAGGMGSGIRVNTAEIATVHGGRPMVAQVEAKLRNWLSSDQKSAIDFGPDERAAMKDMVDLVRKKVVAKQQALSKAGGVISGEKVTDQQRRDALQALDMEMRAVDNPDVAGPTQPAAGSFVKPGGALEKLLNGSK